MAKKYAIDVPNPYNYEDVWINYDYFDTKEEAVAAAKRMFGADDEGRIAIVSEFEDEDSDG
jgi:hypothetical protein